MTGARILADYPGQVGNVGLQLLADDAIDRESAAPFEKD